MNRSSLPLLLLLSASLMLALPRHASADQTGNLVLEVVDADGNAVPDVAITLEGKKLQGLRVRETDELGRARFALLPPGDYEAEFEAEGFVTFRRTFAVALGSARVETVQMVDGTMTETQVVSGTAAIDVTETSINYTFSEEKMQALQIGSTNRSYLSVLGRAAGVVGGGGNPNVHGATVGENRYLVDGVDTTDPVTGTWGHALNFDSIEAIEFQTGGFRAESGQATGGIVNVITKSGSNELEAIVDVRYNDNGLQDSSALEINGEPAFDNSSPTKFRRIDLTLGGPMIKDKLWYQLAYSDQISNSQPPGGDATRDFSSENRLFKLTWQPHESHRVSVQYSGDPATIENVNSGTTVRGDAHRHQDQGADFYSATYWGEFANNWNLNLRASTYESVLDSYPQVDSGLPSRVNLLNGYLSQNYNDAQYSTRTRDQFGWDLNHQTSGKRWHSVKFGMDVQLTELTFRREQPGGLQEYVLGGDDEWGTNGPVVRTDRLVSTGTLANEGSVMSLYLQDTWYATDRITVDYGIRWDRTAMDDDTGEEVVDYSLFQPRFGIAWDVLGDKRHALSFSAARYMDPLILTVANAVNKNGNSTILALNESVYGLDCNGDGVLDDALIEDCITLGGPSGSVTDPDLDAQYKDEVSLGYKFAIRSNLTFGARWYWSETENIIEDYQRDDGVYEVTNLEGLVRRYQGLELDVGWEGRRVHLFSNWTISGSKGNVEYTQHLGSDYDINPDHYTNRYGYLGDDRRHRLKLYGWVDLPKKFRIGWDSSYLSGASYTVVDAQTPVYGQIFVEPRGSRRLPSLINIDAEVRKAWDVGEKGEIELIGSIFNLLKANTHTEENGNIDALGEITSYQRPRRYEVGFRFRWQ